MPFLTPVLVGRVGSPTIIDYRKKNWYPYSNSLTEDLAKEMDVVISCFLSFGPEIHW